jgi:hypothetical protein
MKTKIFFDTEFIEDGRTIELISIGLIKDTGEKLYLENSECDLNRACPWVKQNVVPKLEKTTSVLRTRKEMAEQIVEFAGRSPEFWGYFAAYDWVALAQLYGRMLDLPKYWPMFCRDVMQLSDTFNVPKNTWPRLPNDAVHNALNDAVWTRDVYYHVVNWHKRG